MHFNFIDHAIEVNGNGDEWKNDHVVKKTGIWLRLHNFHPVLEWIRSPSCLETKGKQRMQSKSVLVWQEIYFGLWEFCNHYVTALGKLYFHLLSNRMGYDRGECFSFDFEPNGIPFGSKSKGKLSPRSYHIQWDIIVVTFLF